MLSYHSLTGGKLHVTFEREEIKMKFFNTLLLFYIIFRIGLLKYLLLIANYSLFNLFSLFYLQRLDLPCLPKKDRSSVLY